MERIEEHGLSQGEEKKTLGNRGEDIAAAYFRKKRWRVVARNVRPCMRDRRCEIDLVVQGRNPRQIVFVEVKTHKAATRTAHRLAGVDARKKRNLLRACASWIMHRRWHGAFRLDVLEIYEREDGQAEIDHIENVPLFPPHWRFW